MDKSRIIRGRHAPQKQAFARTLRGRMTPAESLLWQRLRKSGLRGLHFRRQQVIDGFVADFYCHAAGLIVEADGGSHAGRAQYDRLRQRVISARGLTVLRFSNDRIEHDLEAVLGEILAVSRDNVEHQRARGAG